MSPCQQLLAPGFTNNANLHSKPTPPALGSKISRFIIRRIGEYYVERRRRLIDLAGQPLDIETSRQRSHFRLLLKPIGPYILIGLVVMVIIAGIGAGGVGGINTGTHLANPHSYL